MATWRWTADPSRGLVRTAGPRLIALVLPRYPAWGHSAPGDRRRGATRSRERARLTAQRQVLEAGQHLPEEARFREALIERQAYGSYADPDPHADLEQLEADRAALRPCQPCAGQAPASQSFQQHVGEVRWLRFRGHLGVR